MTKRHGTRVVESLIVIAAFLILALASASLADPKDDNEAAICWPENMRVTVTKSAPPHYIPKQPGHYSAEDWAAVIDSTWGAGLSQTEEMSLFDLFWTTADVDFACWQGLSLDWDSVWVVCSTEVATGNVSKGRMAAMLDHAGLALADTHTRCNDDAVHYTDLLPGVPILVCGDFTGGIEFQNFGAALTPQPDSSLLVYRAVSNHPLGLVPGDKVLGYDGIPWSDLYPQMIDAQLPIVRYHWGSTEESSRHLWMMGAGQNWHLFDSVDVVKYTTGDTLRMSTQPLTTLDSAVFPSEQMDIPGVPMPDWIHGRYVSYGIIEGTRIGYIYHWGWDINSGNDFTNAVNALKNDTSLVGIIVDGRFDYGGNLFSAWPGLELLFGTNMYTYAFSTRCRPDDHFQLCSYLDPETFFLRGAPSGPYDKPIAVLSGPGAVSSGDFVTRLLAWHPMARTFGKTTTGAYSAPFEVNTGLPNFNFTYSIANSFVVDTPSVYLTHTDMTIDDPVWLTPDNVALGIDDVVKAAETWIGTFDADGDGVPNGSDNCPATANPDQIDADNDGAGDVCDDCIDSDFDGIGDPGFASYGCGEDNCPTTPNPGQEDANNDGEGDACCCNQRGDINHDLTRDITDLTFMVDYLFASGSFPPCPAEGDVDGSSETDIADLTSFVDFLFAGGAEPPACP